MIWWPMSGTAVSVAGKGVMVGGEGVSVGGETAVADGGTGVDVTVLVGRDVAVGGAAVGVDVGVTVAVAVGVIDGGMAVGVTAVSWQARSSSKKNTSSPIAPETIPQSCAFLFILLAPRKSAHGS